jgi:hypothetical protein
VVCLREVGVAADDPRMVTLKSSDMSERFT